MSVNKTIERIKAIPDNWLLFAGRDDGTETRPFIATDDLKALAKYTERLETAANDVLGAIHPIVYSNTAKGKGIGGQTVTGEDLEDYRDRVMDLSYQLQKALDSKERD